MKAEDLIPTDDPLVMRGKGGNAYVQRRCAYEPCSRISWVLKDRGRFCSDSCASKWWWSERPVELPEQRPC